MSNIAFILGQLGSNKKEVVQLIRSKLEIEVGKILASAGTDIPLLAQKLFDRAHPNFATTLHSVLTELEHLGVPYEVYEFLNGEEFTILDRSKLFKINAITMQNIIEARALSLQEQFMVGGLQDSVD